MSAVVGVFDRRGRPVEETVVQRMLEPLRRYGDTTSVFRAGSGALLAVARYEWERDDGIAGRDLVVVRGDHVVAADASIYYRQDLRQRLAMRGVEAAGDSPGHLILAAYAAWGERCAERLEGDFAFVVYDRCRRTVFCARSASGRRPLFYAELGDAFVVGSSVGAIRAHPDCPEDLNLAAIGAAAAALAWSWGSDTCYSAIQVVPMAGSLFRGAGSRLWRHWTPPRIATGGELPFDSAAEELRELLAQAVLERMSPTGRTAVWMSGGWDSTAVFGAGRYALQSPEQARQLIPVSISYPPGDLGREDELIETVAEAWSSPVHWLDIEDIPLFHREPERAAKRDEPGAFLYENWNCALAGGARDIGARVALDGNGGDQLFGSNDIYLSDLFRTGRWLTLWKELRRRPKLGGLRALESTVAPLIPPALHALKMRLQGRPVQLHYLERPVPPWIKQDFVASHKLLERQRAHLPPARTRLREPEQLRWSLTTPLAGYVFGVMQAPLLQSGVLVCSPLLDKRVVEFALRRPRWERIGGGQTKLLLRRSMRGLLPDRVLAPRPYRTGMTLSYSRRSMKRVYPGVFEELFRSPLVVAELGIVDTDVLREAVTRYLSGGGDGLRIQLFHTWQTELWLRARRFATTDPVDRQRRLGFGEV